MRSIHRIMSIAIVGASMATLFSGCAKAPDQELAAAKTAISAAQTAEADKYLPDRYNNAMKAFEAAQSEITRQNTIFILTRKYSQATRLLGIATSLATACQADAAGAKEQFKSDVAQDLVAAQTAMKEARKDVKDARKTQLKNALKAMTAELDAADNSLVQAASEFAAGNYPTAAQKIGEAKSKMKKISDKLSTGGGASLM
jgi:hypothetical protein